MCMNEIALLDREMAKDEGVPVITKRYRIPYEEMRPPEKRRGMFSCQRGIRSEDILRPIERNTNFYGTPLPIVQHLKFCKNLEPAKKMEIPLPETTVNVNQAPQKRSRIEQLKFLVQQKDTLRCMSPTA
ncbi:uncharacterized protein LOC114872918 [Osmia bicornis bicornis]|uniref:uncharacterized protein LOC114872918 n=1 Tax=Osmia bicornis bicornis TaxID=1437191 RepID=UPI001EAEB622|nr:uncharacterized protein LOC114872918 [Osmia bicornis bicornis]